MITHKMGEKIKSLGGEIRLNAEVIDIIRESMSVQEVRLIQNGEVQSLKCAGVINTLPINEALMMVENYCRQKKIAL